MNTGDYAFIISIFSVLIAIASFVWNVWSKFIFPKPRVNASAGVFSMFSERGTSHPHLALSFTNYGPGEVTIHLCCMLYKRFPWSKTEHAMINPIQNFPLQPYQSLGPFSGGLPKKLLVGESHVLRFPYEAQSFLAVPFRKIGAVDTFGRHHWAPSKQVRSVRAQFTTEFPNVKRDWGDDPPEDDDRPN